MIETVLSLLNVYTAEGTQSFFVSSGSYTVNNDSTVSIIAEEACKLADLDKEAATKALAAAQGAANSGDAEAQIEVDVLTAVVAAIYSKVQYIYYRKNRFKFMNK